MTEISFYVLMTMLFPYLYSNLNHKNAVFLKPFSLLPSVISVMVPVLSLTHINFNSSICGVLLMIITVMTIDIKTNIDNNDYNCYNNDKAFSPGVFLRCELGYH